MLQTAAAAKFPGLEAASMYTTRREGEGGATGEAGTESSSGSPRFSAKISCNSFGRHCYCVTYTGTHKHGENAQFSHSFNINKYTFQQTHLEHEHF